MRNHCNELGENLALVNNVYAIIGVWIIIRL